MTSEALGGQLQSCYTARARPKCLTEEKCFKTTLEQSYRVAAQSISVQRVPNSRSGATERAVGEVSSVVGLWSSGVVEERR